MSPFTISYHDPLWEHFGRLLATGKRGRSRKETRPNLWALERPKLKDEIIKCSRGPCPTLNGRQNNSLRLTGLNLSP
jgi:hypothetical protein